MRKYETFFILDPDLPDEANAAVDEKFQSVISSNGGTLLSSVPWGKRKLAYPVKKRTRGNYVLIEFAGGPELVSELERNMRLDERVLKFITVKLDDRFDPDKEQSLRASSTSAADESEESSLAAVAASKDLDEDEDEDESQISTEDAAGEADEEEE